MYALVFCWLLDNMVIFAYCIGLFFSLSIPNFHGLTAGRLPVVRTEPPDTTLSQNGPFCVIAVLSTKAYNRE